MKKNLLISLIGVSLFWSCKEQEVTQPSALQQEQVKIVIPDALKKNGKPSSNTRIENQLVEVLNSTLFSNTSYKVSQIHVCTLASSDHATSVTTLDEQFESTLPSRWVPGDARRDWNGDGDLNDIDWIAFPPLAIANRTFDANPIYQNMYDKWENGTYCKTVNIDKTPYNLLMGNPSLILGIGGLDPADWPLADVSVVGFLPASIFESILGSKNVLGVAFSFTFRDPATGEPIKTNRGKEDKAFTEVWFNDGFPWSKGVQRGKVDLESVILHEFGHTLNLGHFGILQEFKNENGTYRYDYQPVNTMNAQYIGQSRNFLGENDKGNFCEAWGSWPWN